MIDDPHPTEPALVRAEAYVRALASELIGVHPGECHPCYVERMLEAHACIEFRFAEAFRAQAAPAATTLVQRLERTYGCRCDCETLRFAFTTTREPDAAAGWPSMRRPPASRRRPIDAGEPAAPSAASLVVLGPCRGVRRGSAQPCARWRRIAPRRRPRW